MARRRTALGSMVAPASARARMMPDGRVLYAGGGRQECDPQGELCYDVPTANAEVYTP